MDAIDVLFKEYDTLRAELVARANNAFRFVGIVVTIAAVALAWLGTQQPSQSNGGTINVVVTSDRSTIKITSAPVTTATRPLWAAVGVVLVLLSALFWFRRVVRNDTLLLCRRLQEIERQVNDRFGLDLLRWETKWGGAALRRLL
jgi:hypothetical protein